MTASPATPSNHGPRTTFPAALPITLTTLAAVAPLAVDACLPAFAQMADGLGVSVSSVRLTVTAFLVGIALGQPGIRVLSDRIGRHPPLLWDNVLTLATSTGAALSPSPPVLLIARFFQGLEDAVGMVLGRTVIPDHSRGITAARALSVVMAIQGIAPVVAPTLGGVLAEPIGWHGILGVVAAFTGLPVVMVLLWMPESLSAERRRDDGLRMLLDGIHELAHDHVLVHLLFINALSFGLLMAYLSTAPFVLCNVLGMGTVVYTAAFGLCETAVTVTTVVTASLVRRFSQTRQVRAGLTAGLVVGTVFAGICLTWLREPMTGPERTPLLAAVVTLFLTHVTCPELSMGNASALALDRISRWARTGSASLGFLQFVVDGLVNPLVGLASGASDMAFGVVIVVVDTITNVLAVFGLCERDEKQRLATRVTECRQRRLGQ